MLRTSPAPERTSSSTVPSGTGSRVTRICTLLPCGFERQTAADLEDVVLQAIDVEDETTGDLTVVAEDP